MLTEREVAATRIVEIQEALRAPLSSGIRQNLVEEQRRLWDTNYSGQPFENIAHDVWLVRKIAKY
jgi:hypothetical protein